MKTTRIATAVATLFVASAALAELPEDYAYVPDTQNCTVPWSMATAIVPALTFSGSTVDKSCMDLQKTSAAIEYCVKFSEDCSRSLIMIGDVPLVLEYPKYGSVFWSHTANARGFK